MRLGSDPEFFLIDQESLELVPVCGKIGADKWNPLPIPGLAAGYCIQEDNVAVEFNIPPCDSRDKFIEAMRTVRTDGLAYLRSQEVKKTQKVSPLAFSSICAYVFPKETLEPHPQAMIFGCEPDYNAWTGKTNPKPALKGKMANLRTCGGHIHVETDLPKDRVIKAMDLFLAIPMVGLEKDARTNGLMRKKLYGKLGAYRPKSYGVEYRTLSNAWCQNDTMTSFVWEATERALEAVAKDIIDLDALGATLQAIGNAGNEEAAESLCDAFDLPRVPNHVTYSF